MRCLRSGRPKSARLMEALDLLHRRRHASAEPGGEPAGCATSMRTFIPGVADLPHEPPPPDILEEVRELALAIQNDYPKI